MSLTAESLRKAIDNLIDAKLQDVLRPGGMDRLIAHRVSGVSSPGVRHAERQLDEALEGLMASRRRARRREHFEYVGD
jgi:hypothetical protein